MRLRKTFLLDSNALIYAADMRYHILRKALSVFIHIVRK
jgi:hypothetical protein